MQSSQSTVISSTSAGSGYSLHAVSTPFTVSTTPSKGGGAVKLASRALEAPLAPAATDHYWSGYGGSDDISDSNNWYNGTPITGDNLKFDNTAGPHHYAYFNSGDFSVFGNVTFYNGAGGGQLYGDALKFTDYLQNYNDGNQWRVYNSNVSETVSSGSTFYIISNGGGLYFKLDGSGGTGASSGGSLYLDYNLEVQGGSAITFENIIANGSNGAKGVTITNSNTTTFSGSSANTYTGTSTITNGTLSMAKSTDGVDAIAGDIVINGGTLNYGNAINNQIKDSAKLTLTSGTLTFGARSETIGEAATGTSGLLISGGAITKTSGTVTVANSATMTGGSVTTTTASGNFTINTDFNFSGGLIDFTSSSGSSTASLNLRGGNLTGITYSSSGTSTAQITNSGGGTNKVSLDGTGGSTSVFNIADSASVATEMIISTQITGGAAGGVQKTGAGVLIFNGANTYSGPTAVNAGTLLANNTTGSATSGGAVSVNNTGTLLGGTGTIGGAVTVNPGARITGGTDGTVGTLTLMNTATLAGASGSLATFVVDLLGATSDRLVISGALDLSNLFDSLSFSGSADGTTTYILATFSSVIGVFNDVANLPGGYGLFYNANNLELSPLTPVPEPATWVVGLLTLLAVGSTQLSRFRRKSNLAPFAR